MKTLKESILDKDFDIQITTLNDVLKERHRYMVDPDIKSFAEWMVSQKWSKKKNCYITTPSYQKKQWLDSCITNIAYHYGGFNETGTCEFIKYTTGNIFYMYCPVDEKHFSIVTIDCTGDDVKFNYKLSEKNNIGGLKHTIFLGTWPSKLNDYLIEHI